MTSMRACCKRDENIVPTASLSRRNCENLEAVPSSKRGNDKMNVMRMRVDCGKNVMKMNKDRDNLDKNIMAT